MGTKMRVKSWEAEPHEGSVGHTYTAMKPMTVRSKISSSYRSFSSGLNGANTARIELRRPDPGIEGSIWTGCISETLRDAPMGKAEDGAMVAEVYTREDEVQRVGT